MDDTPGRTSDNLVGTVAPTAQMVTGGEETRRRRTAVSGRDGGTREKSALNTGPVQSTGLLALHHPAAETLMGYATHGCPTHMDRPWTQEEITAAVHTGSHISALDSKAMAILANTVQEKV